MGLSRASKNLIHRLMSIGKRKTRVKPTTATSTPSAPAQFRNRMNALRGEINRL